MNQTPSTVIQANTPPAGTLQATLETIGTPTIPTASVVPSAYDFGLMLKTLEPLDSHTITWTVDDAIGSTVKTATGEFDENLKLEKFFRGMAAVALSSHRFFSGSPCLHFYLPKMDIQTGVLGFRYMMNYHTASTFPSDPVQMNYTQWDVSQQNYFKYQIPNFQPYDFRNMDASDMLATQFVELIPGSKNLDVDFSKHLMENTNDSFGRLRISVEHPLVGGSIAPSKLSILVYFNFPNTELTNLCALRAGTFITPK